MTPTDVLLVPTQVMRCDGELLSASSLFFWSGMHRVWKDEFVNMLGIAPGYEAGSPAPKVLDVAGGTGDIAFR